MPISASYGHVLSVEQSYGSCRACMKRFIFTRCTGDMQLRLSVMSVFSAEVDNF